MARIGIAGAGVIGAAMAVQLIERGHDVTVFEKDGESLPASVGNASILAIPEIDPIARPDMVFSAPKWLMDPLGPLTLRWQDLPALTPWLLALLAAARPSQVEASRQALTVLMREALSEHAALGEQLGLSGHIRHTGALHVYDSQTALDKAYAHDRQAARILGFEVERLDAAATRARVPALEGHLAGAVFSGGYHTLNHPQTFLDRLREVIRARGTLVDQAVTAVVPTASGVSLCSRAGDHAFDKVAVAAGVWSRELVRGLGLRVALETERGYNTTWTDPAVTLPMPVFFSEHGFVATPLDGALRVGGAVELAKPEAPANFARAQAMRTRMRRYVPALPEAGGVEWMGRRPSTPDSVPVIGLSPQDPRIAFAFGHGHLGLTLSAITGRHIADLLEGRRLPELAPFSISRFQ
ncbi:amino acid dehydrogenase [Rhizobium rhizosphaerae]|uniref:Amino acid dehydrogenase n=1 Tax=Xaviernesmea rhizosphaerae TaxID=1672749 RepID=A0ABX3PAC1_9HYPH|nr:FAD-dependent oxidoreductase [Xaviernesmea rhizosphaerae]OQP84744.1 amino acid dehydrogenase [Xaviernesmea rhizosphaerae]